MQIRVVTLQYNETLQGFPEDALKTASFGREVLNASEHFFVHGNVSHLTLVLPLGDSLRYENAGSYHPRDPNAPDPEDGMTDEQKTRYRALKTWRNETAKSEAWRLHDMARQWLKESRGVDVKDEATVVAPVSECVPFLGLTSGRIAGGLRGHDSCVRDGRSHGA